MLARPSGQGLQLISDDAIQENVRNEYEPSVAVGNQRPSVQRIAKPLAFVGMQKILIEFSG